MSQEETSSSNGAQGDKRRRQTDAGDIVAVICCTFCVSGVIWQFIDYGFLGGAKLVADIFDFPLEWVWMGALSNASIWAFGAYCTYLFKHEEQMTAGARALAAIACVCVARFLVWILAQLFGLCVGEGGLFWTLAYPVVCALVLYIAWFFVKEHFSL